MPSAEQKTVARQTQSSSGACYAVMGTTVAVMKPNKRAGAVERPPSTPPTQITELN